MKSATQSNKLLENFISELQNQLKRRIKFRKDKITPKALSQMAVQYLQYSSNVSTPQKNNQNHNTLNYSDKLSPKSPDKNQQVDVLKRKITVERQLYKRFVTEFTKNRIFDEGVKYNKRTDLILKGQSLEVNNSCLLGDKSSISMLSSIKSSAEKKQSSKKRGRNLSEFNQGQKQKNKTFAKLRKLEALVCTEKSNSLSTNKMNRSIRSSWNFDSFPEKKESQKRIITQENQNLKAIQNNLVVHLSIMEKYRDIPSIQGLVLKQQTLRKKEISLRQHEQNLAKKQVDLNKKHSQILRKQKSLRFI